MKTVKYKDFIKKLNNEQLAGEKAKIEKLLSSMPLVKIIDFNTKEPVTKNVLHDAELQKRLHYRNQYVALAKRVSEISQHFRWNYGRTWLRMFDSFYKDDKDAFFDLKLNTLTDHKGGFINSLDSNSLRAFNEYLKHYLQYIKDHRQDFEWQNNHDIEMMEKLKVIYIMPDYNLREDAIKYANRELRNEGFMATDVNFSECFDDKWKNYYIGFKKYQAINLEQKQRLSKENKPVQIELDLEF